MTITARASYYFVTKDNEGWSENLYVQGTDLPSCVPTAGDIITDRMALSPNNVSMVFAKVSDVAVKGDSLIVLPTSGHFPAVGTHTEVPTGAFLEANTAMLIELLGGATKKNRLFLRGLSLDVVTGREYLAPSGFVTALTTWLTYLQANMFVRTQVVPHTTPKTYTYAAMTDAYFQVVTARKPGRPFDLPRGRKFSHRV